MCGICGIIDFKRIVEKNDRQTVVRSMNRAMEHRGPDEDGYFNDDLCTLAMRRLAIIDLSGGQQPIFNEDGKIGVVYNGEIYNFQELKAELEGKGHRFSTRSDTETLVHLYEEYGVEMFTKLKGMFAFCLFDTEKKQFLIARDRFGEKPLYYFHQNGLLAFASEISALLQFKAIPRRLNIDALPYYFRTSLVPDPITLFKDIKSLPAGNYLQISASGLVVKPYFSINYKVDKGIKTKEDAIEFIKPYLVQAVKRQTISDVPIGAFLSGGIDSSTIVALVQKYSSQPIQTFTARFEHQPYDESPIAKEVSEFCGTEHHELLIPNDDFQPDIFWKIIDHVGLPFRDSSAIPTYLITQSIRKHVKVALSGDGGDELFGGYALFQWYQKILGLKKIPKPIRQISGLLLSKLSAFPGFDQWSSLRKLNRGVQTSLEAEATIPIALNEMFTGEEISNLIQNQGQKGMYNYERLQKYPEGALDWSPLRKIMYYRNFHTLPGNMLIKVDRMSMANSLEVRAPFLDPDLFEASTKLPDQFLINKGLGKYIIRQIMKEDLPKVVFEHPKQGFSIPLHHYQNDQFIELAKELLFSANPFPDLFDSNFIQQIFQQGVNQKKDSAHLSAFRANHRLWMLMQLFGWGRRFGVGG